MTNDDKNKILELRDSGASLRQIAKKLDMSLSVIHDFLIANAEVRCFSACPVCHKSIIHYKRSGRHRIYCSNKCRFSPTARKKDIRICLFCHKPYKAYRGSKTKFCSHKCYTRYRYER